jgi:hypothetical protein
MCIVIVAIGIFYQGPNEMGSEQMDASSGIH